MCGPNAVKEDPCAKKNKKRKQGEKDVKSTSVDKDNKDEKEVTKGAFATASAVGKKNKSNNNKRDKDANAKKETNKKPTNKKNENLKQNERKSKCRKQNSIRVSKNGKKLMKDRLPNRFDVRVCDVMRIELEHRDLCRW